jgi:hypothetical protein
MASAVRWAIIGTGGSQAPVCGTCSGSAALTAGTSFTNPFGVTVVDQSFSLPDLSLSSGTYWLELFGLVTSDGSAGYWDMNGGPSLAWESEFGDVSGANCTADQPGKRTPNACRALVAANRRSWSGRPVNHVRPLLRTRNICMHVPLLTDTAHVWASGFHAPRSSSQPRLRYLAEKLSDAVPPPALIAIQIVRVGQLSNPRPGQKAQSSCAPRSKHRLIAEDPNTSSPL